MKWENWGAETISVRASGTKIESNEFRGSHCGICVSGQKSRGNSFGKNLFEGVKTPIRLLDGSNDGVGAPVLTIVRSDEGGGMGHVFTLRFRGKAKARVFLELGYSADEAREEPQIRKIKDSRAVLPDERGEAVWRFRWKGYPVGSWTAAATQGGSTSAFSNVVVMPYL